MPPRATYRAIVSALSLIVGPGLMALGELLHPKEKMHAAAQANVIYDHASRWYAAHLLLFIGILIFIPGFLALTALASERSAAAGYVARVLVLIGAAVFASVFVSEFLVGRYVSDGASLQATTALMKTLQSGAVTGVELIGAFAFFVGVGLFAVPLIYGGGSLRWCALLFGAGALFIVADLMSAQIVLGQVGSIILLVSGVTFALQLLRREQAVTA